MKLSKCQCGQRAEIKVTAITEQQRNRQKKLLIRLWNDRQAKNE